MNAQGSFRLKTNTSGDLATPKEGDAFFGTVLVCKDYCRAPEGEWIANIFDKISIGFRDLPPLPDDNVFVPIFPLKVFVKVATSTPLTALPVSLNVRCVEAAGKAISSGSRTDFTCDTLQESNNHATLVLDTPLIIKAQLLRLALGKPTSTYRFMIELLINDKLSSIAPLTLTMNKQE